MDRPWEIAEIVNSNVPLSVRGSRIGSAKDSRYRSPGLSFRHRITGWSSPWPKTRRF